MSHNRTNSTEVAWYKEAIGPKLGPTARKILEEYSKIPADQLESHVSKIVCLSPLLCIKTVNLHYSHRAYRAYSIATDKEPYRRRRVSLASDDSLATRAAMPITHNNHTQPSNPNLCSSFPLPHHTSHTNTPHPARQSLANPPLPLHRPIPLPRLRPNPLPPLPHHPHHPRLHPHRRAPRPRLRLRPRPARPRLRRHPVHPALRLRPAPRVLGSRPRAVRRQGQTPEPVCRGGYLG
jgi:hypothetical protein